MKQPKKIRVRFAPSPTGFLHIGGLRTALYNYLFARKNKGIFMLRIEDTDAERTVPGALENILHTLKICGLKYQGKPIIQSKRLAIYKKYAEELVKMGKAYYCFCAPQRLEQLRKDQAERGQPTMYDGHCRNKPRQDKTQKFVIRLKVPREGMTEFDDIIHGRVQFENKLIDDQILLKSDGYPTYHLANIVDDHLMKITHVIRGEEWLPSTPKHVLLYQALGWELPQFSHLPLLLNPDRSKLSKRAGDVAAEDYLNNGYLPEALLNFIALLGGNPTADQEIFSLKELEKIFALEKINKSGAVFNLEKLDWLNGYYIRQKSLIDLTKLCIPYLIKSNLICQVKKQYHIAQTDENIVFAQLKQIVGAERERLKKLADLPATTEFFFKDPSYEAQLLSWKGAGMEKIKGNLIALREFLSNLSEKDFQNEKKIEDKIKKFIEEKNLGVGETLWPMRVALSGRSASPSPFTIAAILGKEKTLSRIDVAIKKL